MFSKKIRFFQENPLTNSNETRYNYNVKCDRKQLHKVEKKEVIMIFSFMIMFMLLTVVALIKLHESTDREEDLKLALIMSNSAHISGDDDLATIIANRALNES